MAMEPETEGARGRELFFSYAHEDEALRDKLAKQLIMLQRKGLISGWHDRAITAGADWGKEIDAHLESASIILLLVSDDFLASEYCYGVEMKRALERQDKGEARVIPIILRAVDCSDAPFKHLQALPTDGKPVTSWPNQDEAFTNIAKQIRRAIEHLNAARSSNARRLRRRVLLRRIFCVCVLFCRLMLFRKRFWRKGQLRWVGLFRCLLRSRLLLMRRWGNC